MQNTRNTQHQLNLPFAFQEVLLSDRDKAKLQQGHSANQLFGGGDTSVLTEYKTRELAIRLRTFNNANETMFTLPDGTPVTEVSIYGSRDRQYLAAPYSAVTRLMNGEFPQGDAIKNAIVKDGMTIDAMHSALEDILLEQLGKEGGIVQRLLEPGVMGDRKQHPFQDWDTRLVQAFMGCLTGFKDEIDAVLHSIDASAWWWPWTDPFKSQAADVMDRYNKAKSLFAEIAKDMRAIDHAHFQLQGVLEQLGIRGGIVRLTLEQKQQQIQMSDTPVVHGFMGQLAGFSDEMGALIGCIETSKVPRTDQLEEIKGKVAEIMDRFKQSMKIFLVDLYPELNRT